MNDEGRYVWLSSVSLALAALTGCAPAEVEEGAQHTDAIVGGEQASDFSEAVLIDSDSGYLCSGALIAPRVVLTAGHCTSDAASWTVTAPYANKQRAKSRKSWTEYVDSGPSVNPNSHDVGLLILDTPITLAAYPTLAMAPVPDGTKAINVGRIQDAVASSKNLFAGRPIALQRGAPDGFKFSYVSEEVIESGDSGGPVYVGTSSSRRIVAVNSGAARGIQALARVDLAYTKIQQVLVQYESAPWSSGDTDPGTDEGAAQGEGSCWSRTLQKDLPEYACVESGIDLGWFQCKDGQWYRGGDGQEGRFEPCNGSYPLRE